MLKGVNPDKLAADIKAGTMKGSDNADIGIMGAGG